MSENSSKRYVLLQVEVSDPEESADSGRFITRLTHPSLTGALELSHGEDRSSLMNAITVDLKNIDPVSALFRNLREIGLT
jgi:hypothetical protein